MVAQRRGLNIGVNGMRRMRRMAAVLAMMLILPAGTLAQSAVVATDSLNMREAPSKDSTSLGQFYSGTQVEIVSDAGEGWSEVSIGSELNSVDGYMMSSYLAMGVAADGVTDGSLSMSVVSPYGTQSVVLRSKASNSYDAVAMLTVGETVRVVGISGDYYFVQMDDDSVGCLASDELQ